MGELSGPLAYLLIAWGAVTAVLVILLIYRATLSTREDDQLYLNSSEQVMMATEQQALIARMNRLGKPIVMLSVLSGILLVVMAGVWVWRGFNTF
jgi:hypothetical protein